MGEVAVLLVGASVRRSAEAGERCANPECVYHDVDIPAGREVVDVNGIVYCEEFCRKKVMRGN